MGLTPTEHEAGGEKYRQDLQFRHYFIILANYPSSSCPEMIGLHRVGLHKCVCACILTTYVHACVCGFQNKLVPRLST